MAVHGGQEPEVRVTADPIPTPPLPWPRTPSCPTSPASGQLIAHRGAVLPPGRSGPVSSLLLVTRYCQLWRCFMAPCAMPWMVHSYCSHQRALDWALSHTCSPSSASLWCFDTSTIPACSLRLDPSNNLARDWKKFPHFSKKTSGS